MGNRYDEIRNQIGSRIELAESWWLKGFYPFACSTILQAYDAVERFEKKSNGKCPRNKSIVLEELRSDIVWAVEEMRGTLYIQ